MVVKMMKAKCGKDNLGRLMKAARITWAGSEAFRRVWLIVGWQFKQKSAAHGVP